MRHARTLLQPVSQTPGHSIGFPIQPKPIESHIDCLILVVPVLNLGIKKSTDSILLRARSEAMNEDLSLGANDTGILIFLNIGEKICRAYKDCQFVRR